jgi:predicted TPR repeat methyltransferase
MTEQSTLPNDLHGERAAKRGNPSFVWRAGQDRRLQMILHWGQSTRDEKFDRVLIDGCGVGMYVKALMPYAREMVGIDIEEEHLEIAKHTVPEAFRPGSRRKLPIDAYFDLVSATK